MIKAAIEFCITYTVGVSVLIDLDDTFFTMYPKKEL